MKITERERKLYESLINSDDPKEKKYRWDVSFQQEVLGMLLKDKVFLIQSMQLIRPSYFIDKCHETICAILFDYFGKYKQLPTKVYITNEVRERFPEDDRKVLIYTGEMEALSFVAGLESRDACMDKITEFAREMSLRSAVSTTLDMLEKNVSDKWVKIESVFKEALLIDRGFDHGLDYFQSLEERYDRMAEQGKNKEVFVTGFDSIDRPDCGLSAGGLCRGEIGAFMGMPGVGKCFRFNTSVLMYNGEVKNVQDVVIGDLVMGPDSKPRRVLSTHSLFDWGYEIKPVKGDSYFVNGEHVLSLKSGYKQGILKRRDYRRRNLPFEHHFARMGKSKIFNISVKDWFNQSNHFKKKIKGWRTGVDFPIKEVKIDPYFLGVWLGDGTSRTSEVTTIDQEIIDCVYSEASYRKLYAQVRKGNKYGYSITGKGRVENTLLKDLRHYNLIKNKHVPCDYKVNSKEVRLQVLAGLMDTDGHMTNNCFDFVNKNKQLAEDVVFLARSVGLAAYIKPCRKSSQNGTEGDYWRVFISGNCSIVPVRLSRKKCEPRKQIKDALLTGINILPTSKIEQFYGFEVDGDHLFLLGDFTVVHNSILLTKASVKNLLRGKKVLYVSLEMDQDKIAKRFDSMLSREPISELMDRREFVIKSLKERVKGLEDKRTLVIKQFAAGTADMHTIRAYVAQLNLYGFKPDMICVDYVGEFKDDADVKMYESRQRIVRDLRGYGVEEGHATFTALQPNRRGRESQESGFIDDDVLGDSFGQVRPLDALWSINQTINEKIMGIGRIFVVKHRDGRSRYSFYYKQDKNTLDINEISRDNYDNFLSQASQKKLDHMDQNKFNKMTSRFKPNGGEGDS